MRVWLLAFVVLLAGEAAQAGPNQKAAKIVSGRWDMTQKMAGLPVLMVIRQEGNIYPSFWLGKSTAGELQLRGSEDALTDDLVVDSKGGFTLSITKVPPKQGMEDLIPGGAWTRARPLNVAIEFKEFSAWKRVDGDKRSESEGISLQATFKATFRANDRTAPIEGVANFLHHSRVGTFNLTVELRIPGSELGLEGDQARLMHIKIQAFSPPSRELPPSAHQLEKIELE